MSKVICDVCGTAYPETASQCPICGCAKPENAGTVSTDTAAETGAVSSYTYVKGGRFSKSNVRKRNKAAAAARKDLPPDPDMEEEQQESSGRGLIITLILLILAIVAVIAYICVNFFGFGGGDKPTDPQGTTTAATTTAPEQTTTEDTVAIGIVCTDLTLSAETVSLDAVGDAWLINATPTPSNTTDPIAYTTSDPAVATVTAEGRVTAVGPGEAVITITCGLAEAECTVVCNIETEPTEETTEPTTTPVADGNWRLNREDFTLQAKGETWELYRGDVSKNLITFSSDDETVATFENGVVTAVGPGHTTVRAEYNGKKLSCKVHCSFKDDTTEPTENETPPAPTVDAATLKISKEDVSIDVDEVFSLLLRDSAGNAAKVTWVASKDGICSIDGDQITGVATGTVTVSATYEGKTYECIVRVRA